MKILTLNQMCNEFMSRSKLTDPGVNPRQKTEMEYAFKCGAASVLTEMHTKLSILPEDAAVVYLQMWMDEFKEFINLKVAQFNANRPDN